MSRIRNFIADRRGATAIEYCFIAGIISIAILIGCQLIGINLSAKFMGPLASSMP
jgi:Flp pilus assembly pilin Flp